MRRALLFSSALLLLVAPTAAEVSVTRLPDRRVQPFFEPGPGGPWEQVRTWVRPGDILNASGDLQGDSWPQVLAHPITGRPDVVWSSGGENRELLFSWHDGLQWRSPLNLSRAPGNDELPVMVADPSGNRFVAWTRARNNRDLVLLTWLVGDEAEQGPIVQLSERHDSARRPALAVHGDGAAYVAYEETHNGNDPTRYLAIDRVDPGLGGADAAADSGERPIDIARCATIATAAVPSQPLRPLVHSAGDHLWVDWLDDEETLGWVERVNGVFGDPHYLALAAAGSEEAAREEVRETVLEP